MKETTKKEFQEVISKVPHTTSFILGEKDTIRYNGKKGIFKNVYFGKKIKHKYYLHIMFSNTSLTYQPIKLNSNLA